MNINDLKCISAILFAATLSMQCSGEEGLSSKIDFNCIPCDPVVINADLTLDPGGTDEKTIKAPWYAISYDVTNNAEVDAILVSLSFDMTSQKNGLPIKSTHSLDVSAAIDTEDDNDDGLTTDERVVLTALAPGELYQESGFWYIHGLPEADSFRYRGVGTAVGWFEEDGVDSADGTLTGIPGSRLEKKFRIFTQ